MDLNNLIHSEVERVGVDIYGIGYVSDNDPDDEGQGTYWKSGSVSVYSEDVVRGETTGWGGGFGLDPVDW